MTIYLVSYHPLVLYPEGNGAIERQGLPPFIDYSCRKEPDLMSQYPSITALCRKGKFAPRLREGDWAVYITTKGKYFGNPESHWRLVAILEVYKRFTSHQDAGNWYNKEGLPLPSNCMVETNPPLPIEMTAPVTKFRTDLRKWDLSYWQCVREYGDFLVCKQQFIEVYNPPAITNAMMYEVFGRIPGTQNPGSITTNEFERLKQVCELA